MGLSGAKDSTGLNIVDKMRELFDVRGNKCLCFLCKDSFGLRDNDVERLWLHVVGIHAIDLWLYGHAKMVRLNTAFSFVKH